MLISLNLSSLKREVGKAVFVLRIDSIDVISF